MSDPAVPTSSPAPSPAPESTVNPADIVIPELDPGPMDVSEAKPTKEPTMEEQVDQIRSDLKRRLQQKYPQLTDEVIADWKKRFGRVAIFPIFDELYVIRPLARKEWKDINQMGSKEGQQMSQDAMEEIIAARATVWPQLDPSHLRTASYAGIATTITNYVELISGFNPAIGPILL